ncbi:MAG TPA: hypothetical protein VK196_17030 [Magnetospirillum sp.]|nr:hypothetical protein [Magnetospirillum sp.]
MTDVLPMKYEGGGVFKCLHPKRVKLEVGSVHGWQMAEHRSKASHDHFFACVNEAWKNLPEGLADDFPSPEHLRKWALIKAGFCSETRVVCANNHEAMTLATKAKAMDRYSLVAIDGKAVTIWTADSQRRDAMGREQFQEAKDRALHIISELIGTDAATLRNAA